MRTAGPPLRISLVAPNGRMGKAIAAAAAQDPGFTLDEDHGDVLIDFSVPGALPKSLERAMSQQIPLLIGTTGLEPAADQGIEAAAATIPVLRAPNGTQTDIGDFSPFAIRSWPLNRIWPDGWLAAG